MRDDYETGICPKCNTEFEPPNGKVYSGGYLCPVCRERKYMLLGVVYFARKPYLPEGVTTA